jgi:hypothetical protein
MRRLHFGIERGETVAQRARLHRRERAERRVDEVDDTGFARSGRVVGGNDLRGDRLKVACVVRGSGA